MLVADGDDRVEEDPDLLDHPHQPLDVGLGRIALVGRRLHPVEGQGREGERVPAEGIAVLAQDRSAVTLDGGRQLAQRRVIGALRFGGGQPDRRRRSLLAADRFFPRRHASS